MKPLRIGERVTCAVHFSDGNTIVYVRTTVVLLDVRPFHSSDPLLFDSKRFAPDPHDVYAHYFYRDEGLTWVRGWDVAARDALEAAVRLKQSA